MIEENEPIYNPIVSTRIYYISGAWVHISTATGNIYEITEESPFPQFEKITEKVGYIQGKLF